MRAVLDASAASHLVPSTEHAAALASQVDACDLVIAPALYYAEVANAMWKYVRVGQMDRTRALDRHALAIELVDAFEPDSQLATEALAEATRFGHPVHDLLFVVLARRHGGRLVTMDKRLAELARRIHPDLIA